MDSNTILMSVQDKLPKDVYAQQQLKERLDSLDEKGRNEFMSKISLLGLKSPALVFWVGSFLFGSFGVNRFMIGDRMLGIAKLAILLFYYLFVMLGASLESEVFLGVSSLLGLIVFIWWVADLFLVGKKLRQQNLDKLLAAL